MDRGAWWATCSPWGHKDTETIEQLTYTYSFFGTLISLLGARFSQNQTEQISIKVYSFIFFPLSLYSAFSLLNILFFHKQQSHI